jgi:DNA replication and repair protein RecF
LAPQSQRFLKPLAKPLGLPQDIYANVKGLGVNGFAITQLGLSHFRSHRAARLEFDGRPVAIVGANGAGKTNILEALSMLSPGRGLRRAEGAELIRKPENLGWKITAEVQGSTAAHEVETWAEPGETRTVRIDGKAATQAALGRVCRVLWLVPAMDRLWIEAAEGRRRFLDRITLSFAPDHAEAVLAYDKAMRDRNRLLKDQVSDARWYAVLEGQMADAAAVIVANRAQAVARLMAAQAGAETAFPAADLQVTGPDGEALFDPAALPRIWADTRGRDLAAGRTLVGPHRADLAAVYRSKGVAADQCSTGEQKALLISLILSNARALTADLGAAPVLLLDEVAAHLDATRRAALYDEICALGCQAIMTGTEISLFDTLGTRGQTVTVKDIGDQSVVGL